ncbi:DUF6233 domain-containing protein [Streptomyces tropicalis]|uniref:DUF6233 domain-containing protein n=1 Tax=Streptomyces tropicalis TaxID=3034234 RepID=A0ABT6A342_9ACTN|nr:DUF6233 domain-containing protein [Streptomyces tropicalis]MDF3299063.1 DUF6233 domain-containing protein [Streptomyces tropicalis]
MFDDLPPDLERLTTLRVWHAMWLARIDRKIAAVRRRQAEEERGRRSRPRPPEWLVELGIGSGRPPVQVHAGDCFMAGERRRPVGRDEARRLLTTGLKACAHCRPDTRLSLLDLGLPTKVVSLTWSEVGVVHEAAGVAGRGQPRNRTR